MAILAALGPRGPTPRTAPGELAPALVERARTGDAEAFRALVLHHQEAVHALLYRLLAPSGREGQVEDCTQETFLRVYRALPGFNPQGAAKLSTWILTIATRLALNELRRPSLVVPVAELASLPVASPHRADALAERRALGQAIRDALGQLPPDQRAVLVLREMHGLEYAEMAEALDLDLGTLKSRLSRARAAMRAALEHHHG
ncbi:sigma-70 family RNA polymerase sigma factor [Archangium lansingense]|uniref:Sigma-70 family RNA polymerase sigma factor n=1 Tax=Archangium lansingense TaxID=2995310 RepID=A0ABT4AJ17_9BACT|nr:sigma-70 family RNA polymerase sigma factor [Archangium lansinium]MCY1081657.1 sigma-70 family RNA polymerase sigma factor [Archangium lansinium]